LIARKQRVEAEGIRRRKDGTLLHVSILGVGVSGGCGRVATYAIYQDITERKRLEEKVRENERELRLQTEAIPQHIWSALPDGSVDYCNQGLLAYLGLTMEGIRLAGPNFIHPDDRDRVVGAWHQATSQGTAYEVEARMLGSDGQYRWFLERALPFRDDQGQIIKWYGTNTDIEDRKRAENDLQRSQAYLVEGERLSHTGSWAWNVSTGQSYWSEETFRIFGFDPAKTKPSFEMFLERVHPEDRPKLEQECNGMSIETKDGELDFRIILPDGSIKYIHAVGHAVINESGEVTERFGVHVDMTEQHQARAALEKAYEEINRLKDQLYKENLALREEIDQASMFEEIVGSSPALQRVLSNVAKVAPTDSTVLITGETGTGKELIARAIHKRSNRSERAFVKVNCAALPASLIGSELFGHEKGAFTGALQRRLGRFELAEGGSIFLDEIGDLPPETQIALLRVLQEREFERIGGGEPITADVRVIAATNRDLKAEAAAGTFRADLFYRLNVFPIEVPPLRERLEDIPLLVEYFIGRYAGQAGKKIRNIHKKTLDLFQSYIWPGNLRELQNVIERSVILCEGETLSVDPSWLSKESDPLQPESRPLTERLMEQEREIIESALAASRGRVAGPSGAAARVGMPPSTLEARIKALKIDKKRFSSG
jgi:PAS domain S-box-containing protein